MNLWPFVLRHYDIHKNIVLIYYNNIKYTSTKKYNTQASNVTFDDQRLATLLYSTTGTHFYEVYCTIQNILNYF